MSARFAGHLLASLYCIALLAGCSGGSSGSTDEPASTVQNAAQSQALVESLQSGTQSLEGFWSGTLRSDVTAQTFQVIMLSVKSGQTRILVTDSCTQFAAQLSVAAVSFKSAEASGYTSRVCHGKVTNATFPNGQKVASATMSGAVLTRFSVAGDYAVGGDKGTFTLGYSDAYERPSSAKALAGNYAAGTLAGAIDADGNFSATDEGGSYAGKLVSVDPSRNAYNLSVTYTPAGSQAAVTLSGLALLTDSSAALHDDLLVLLGSNSSTHFSAILKKQ